MTIQERLSKMELRDKIGQLVMVGFDGPVPKETVLRLIRDYRPGGIVYFRRNVERPGQLARLSRDLQRAAASAGSGEPLLIAIDQEGGMVARIDREVALMPGAMALGAAGKPRWVREAAAVTGRELRAMGINMNFAPCLDVNNNPANPVIGVRSYGESPSRVAELGVEAIAGYREGGVAAVAKHFPGHGDVDTDSHLDLPLVPHGLDRLEQVELVPFRAAIAAGVDAIMTAHVRFPAVEPGGLPATLSRRVLTGLIRETLGYDGLVITDCLEMKAIADHFGVEEGAVLAVAAGADMVLVSHTAERQAGAFEALLRAAESGRLPMERVDEAVRRVLRLKERLGAADLPEEPEVLALERQGLPELKETAALAERIAEGCITLVKAELGVLPLRSEEPVLVVWPEVRVGTEVDEVIPQTETLGYWLGTSMSQVREVRIGIRPGEDEIRQVLEAAEGFAHVVAVTYDAAFSEGQVRLVKELASRSEKTGGVGLRLTVASARSPYDLAAFPEVGTYLACYENRPAMMRALAMVLTGGLVPTGILPVDIGGGPGTVRQSG
ncbi:beta-N-acetylhexosaminidase [Gorillibacterium sp. sgz5001074]|uniref:beta-N-acetylhexosaminidase n=1 Tax=Gorillibacterium sp. sgz5001074 TaxID=3446695 RepID=UPI003F67E2B7